MFCNVLIPIWTHDLQIGNPIFGLMSIKFWTHAGQICDPILHPKSFSKLVRKQTDLSEHLLEICFRVWKLFKHLLRAILGALCSSWESPRIKESDFPFVKAHFLQTCFFSILRFYPLLTQNWAPRWTQNRIKIWQNITNTWFSFDPSFSIVWATISGPILKS